MQALLLTCDVSQICCRDSALHFKLLCYTEIASIYQEITPEVVNIYQESQWCHSATSLVVNSHGRTLTDHNIYNSSHAALQTAELQNISLQLQAPSQC